LSQQLAENEKANGKANENDCTLQTKKNPDIVNPHPLFLIPAKLSSEWINYEKSLEFGRHKIRSFS
jgi:hypothetical protein